MQNNGSRHEEALQNLRDYIISKNVVIVCGTCPCSPYVCKHYLSI